MGPTKKRAADKTSPAKAGQSPGRGKVIANRKSATEVRKQKPRVRGWYVEGELVEGGLATFTVTQSDPCEDAYSWNIQKSISNKDLDIPICQQGIINSYNMRRSLKDDRPLYNAKKSEYMRKIYVMMMEPDEMNKEGLHKKLLVVKAFLEEKENNAYLTKVYLPSDWDKTPPDSEPLRRLDHFLQYKELVRFIKDIDKEAGPRWYHENTEAAWCYFTEGHVPREAAGDLGFPDDQVTPPITMVTNDG